MTSKVENQIEKLREFLENCLGKTILDYSLHPLTKPGDNYGSIIQALTVTVSHNGDPKDDHEPEVLQLVAKSPVTNEYLKSIYLPAITCVKENAFYSEFIPAMRQLQKEANVPDSKQINGFIEYVGSRRSLVANAKQADGDALLILQNVKFLGFENGNRFEGFDKNTTLKILEKMADMHALPIAIRLSKPELFKKTFRPYFRPVDMTYIDPKVLPKAVRFDLEYVNIPRQLRRKVNAQIDECVAFSRMNKNGPDTPYSTVVHRDLWANNFMISKDLNGNVSDVKIYDFQLYFYHSFALDLIFFLFTSVSLGDLNKNFGSFIRFYHRRFYETLERVAVNFPLENYTFKLMWSEIKSKAKMELMHALFMNSVSLAEGDKTLESKERPKPSSELIRRLENLLFTFERYDLF